MQKLFILYFYNFKNISVQLKVTDMKQTTITIKKIEVNGMCMCKVY